MSFCITKDFNLQKNTLRFLYDEQTEITENFGGILSTLNYAWLVRKSKFVVVNCKNGFKVGSWDFANSLQDDTVGINAVQEIQRPNGKEPHLIISLNCETKGGLICIFDFVGSKVIRAIQIVEHITNIHVIDREQDLFSLSGPLRNFDGVLAVGTVGGNVYLLDICRQLCYEGFNSFEAHDELNPCRMQVITSESIQNIENSKHIALHDESHLAIFLNVVHNKRTEHFVLKKPDGSDSVHVNKEEVLISALHYCPQLGSILVGYNFGAYQLWNLMNMQLVYTSEICEQHIPIIKFAIQEPVDDPRAFCYVWAVYSTDDLESRTLPFLVMFALCYESKEFHESYGQLYVNFQYCTVRFQRELGFGNNMSNVAPIGGKCLRLDSIVLKKPSNHNEMYMNDGTDDAFSLCVTVWKAVGDSGQSTYLSVFDLNQWYKAQMPNSSNFDDCASYMITLCISDLTETQNDNGVEVLDASLNENTIQQFIGTQRLEEHYYPSSLSFETSCLLENKIVNIQYQGGQRALLAQLQTSGPLCLIRPLETYQEIIDLGLTPLFVEVDTFSAIASLNNQREVILNVALEQQLTSWLCKCASDWANGSFSSAGCSLNLLTSWAFKRAITLKRKCEVLSIPLFDYSVLRLDANTITTLGNCIRQIKNVAFVFSFILTKLSSYLTNKDTISEQYKNLQTVEVYFDVLQWFINIGLLPEYSCSASNFFVQESEFKAPYPVEKLEEYYGERRSEFLRGVNKRFSSKRSILFIDNLINEECGGNRLEKDWEQFGGNGLYPPRSLQALLRTYLLDGIEVCYKHTVIIYLLLDLAVTLDERYENVLTNLVKFPAVFKVTPSLIKIIHAFWQLDHGDFFSAMENLLDPMVNQEDLKNWHHKTILKSLLIQEQHNLALLYMNVRKPPIVDDDDVLCAISLFISNNMLDEAFYLEKNFKNYSSSKKIIAHLFSECSNYGRLSSIINRNLTKEEETHFLQYLDEVKHPEAADLKVTYFMQRSHYIEAFKTYQACEDDPMKKGLISRLNLKARDQIIHTYKKFLPTVSYKFIETCTNEPNPTLWKEVTRPDPMSVYVREADDKTEYKSSLILAALAKAKLTFNENKQNISLMNATTEDIPFLRTPTSMPTKKRSSVQVIIPKIVITEEVEEDGPSPPKKSRLSFSSLSQELDLNSSILSTPIIAKKRRTYVSPIPKNTSDSIATPTSILKVRNSFKDIISDSLTTPSNKTELQSTISGRKSTRSYMVKFDVPSSEEPSPSLNRSSVKEIRNSSKESCENSLSFSHSITPKNISDTDEVYYSPNSSLNNIEEMPKDESNDEKNYANEEEGEELTGKISPKMPAVISNAKQVKLVDYDPSSSSKEGTDSSLPSSPRGRRSYRKLSSVGTPVRSSPRLSRGQVSAVTKRERGGCDYPLTVKEDVPSPIILIGDKTRKSLNRKVLEANTLARLASNVESMETVRTEIHRDETKITTVDDDEKTESSHTKVEHSKTSYSYTTETVMDSDKDESNHKFVDNKESSGSEISDSFIEILYDDLSKRRIGENAPGLSSETGNKEEVSNEVIHIRSNPISNEIQSSAVNEMEEQISIPSTSSWKTSRHISDSSELASTADSAGTKQTTIFEKEETLPNVVDSNAKTEISQLDYVDSRPSGRNMLDSSIDSNSQILDDKAESPRSEVSDSLIEMLYNDLCQREMAPSDGNTVSDRAKEAPSEEFSSEIRSQTPLRITRRLSRRLSEERTSHSEVSLQLDNKNKQKLMESKGYNVKMITPRRAASMEGSIISTETSTPNRPSTIEESLSEEGTTTSHSDANLLQNENVDNRSPASQTSNLKKMIKLNRMAKSKQPLSRRVLENNALLRIVSDYDTSSNEETESNNLNENNEIIEKSGQNIPVEGTLSESFLDEIAWGTLPEERDLLEKCRQYILSENVQESNEDVEMRPEIDNKSVQNNPESDDIRHQAVAESPRINKLDPLGPENVTPSVFERNIVDSDMGSSNESSSDSNKSSKPDTGIIEISSSDDAPSRHSDNSTSNENDQRNDNNVSDLIYGDLCDEGDDDSKINNFNRDELATEVKTQEPSGILVSDLNEEANTNEDEGMQQNDSESNSELKSKDSEAEVNTIGENNAREKEQSLLEDCDKKKPVRRMTRRLSKLLDDEKNEASSLEQRDDLQTADKQKSAGAKRGSIPRRSSFSSESSLNLNATSSLAHTIPEPIEEAPRSINTRKRTRSVDIARPPQKEDSNETTPKSSGIQRARRKHRSVSVDVPSNVQEEVKNKSLVGKHKKKPSSVSHEDVTEGKERDKDALETVKEDVVENFKTSRRLTRRQSTILEQSLDKIDLSIIEKQDPIELLDKVDFKGSPDPQEQKVYETSPSSSLSTTKSGVGRPARRATRTSSNASDDSTTSNKSSRRKGSAAPVIGTRRKLRSSDGDSKSTKQLKEKTPEISDDSAESDTSMISTRSKKSNTDDSTISTKRKRKVTTKSILPEIKEENSEGANGSPAQNTRRGKKNAQK